MKKILTLLAAVLTLAVFTSCDKEKNEEHITAQQVPGCFASVKNIATGTEACYNGISYQIEINYTTLKATVVITGMKLPDGTAYPSMKFDNVPFTANGAMKVISAAEIAPVIPGFASVPLVSNFELKLYDRMFNLDGQQVYNPGYGFKMTINSQYAVSSTYSPQILFGVTESKSTDTGATFTTDDSEYYLEFNPDTRRLKITINNARFAENMDRGLNIELREIPVTFRGTTLSFEVSDIIPFIGDTPFQAFPITDLSGTFDFATGMNLGFTCNPRTAPGAYEVKARTSYSYQTAD